MDVTQTVIYILHGNQSFNSCVVPSRSIISYLSFLPDNLQHLFYTFLSFTVAFLFFPVNPEFYPDLSLFSFFSFNLSSPSNTKCYCALKCHLTAGVIPRLCVLGGDAGLTCGGYLTMEVYHTGLTHPPPSKLGRQERLSISFSSSFCPRSI